MSKKSKRARKKRKKRRRDVSCHAVFGQVTEGMDVLQSLTLRDPSKASSPGDLIKTIRIEER